MRTHVLTNELWVKADTFTADEYGGQSQHSQAAETSINRHRF